MPQSQTRNKSDAETNGQNGAMNWFNKMPKALDPRHSPTFGRFWHSRYQRWVLLIVTSLSSRYYSLTVGEPAQETIISPISFKVIDQAATEKIKDDVLKSVLPVYDFDDEVLNDVQQRVANAFAFMREYLSMEAQHKAPASDKGSPSSSAVDGKQGDKASFRPLDDAALRTRFENLLGAPVPPSSFEILKSYGFSVRIERDITSIVVPVMLRGIVLSRELLRRDGKQGILLFSKSSKKLEPLKDISSILDLHEAFELIDTDNRDYSRDPALSLSIRQIAKDLIYVNITYNRVKSETLKSEALATVKPVFFQISKGEPIINAGEPANEGHLRKLAGLNKSNPAYSRYMIFLGIAMILVVLLRLSLYFSETYLDRSGYATQDLLLFCLLVVGSIILVRFVCSLSPLLGKASEDLNVRSILYVAPIATAPMLASLMVNARIALLVAVLTSLACAFTVEGDVYLFFYYFVAGVVGLHGMTKVSDRTSVLRGGLVVGVVSMLCILAIKMALGQLTNPRDVYEIGLGFVGGILCGLLVSGLAPLLEPLGFTTNIRLLEIANLNHPLLKNMSMEAPGTYHHSMMVGNLAEAGAELIGANPVLARVGGLYHDVGKVGNKFKPSYYIENHISGANPHDKLEPSMSALILISHVKNGVEKAREYRIPEPIIDIIQQHHGTTLIKFFFNKAVEKASKGAASVPEDKYHYPGPKPQTKEAALVMMADVTEAAIRTLSEPTPAQIRKRVQTLIHALFAEGQLDESSMTLKDIHAIINTFCRTFQAILHTRIEYPEENLVQDKKHGDSHKQQSDALGNRLVRPAGESNTDFGRIRLQ